MPGPSARAPRTLVLLVRHGRTPTTGKLLPGRAPGLHLSDEGKAQAEETARRIAAAGKVAAVYSSPMERAQETAAPIAAASGCAVQIEEGLLECDFGAWTGAELAALRRKREWVTVQRWPSGWQFPDGESFLAMQERMIHTIRQICGAHPGKAVVAVSHADPIKAALSHALGAHLDLFQRVDVSPASVSTISYGADGPMVLAVNSSAALPRLAPDRPRRTGHDARRVT